MDGVGEWATATMGVVKGNEIRLFREFWFPHSLGFLYSAFTAYLGFEVNQGECKVMGITPFGRHRHKGSDIGRSFAEAFDAPCFCWKLPM